MSAQVRAHLSFIVLLVTGRKIDDKEYRTKGDITFEKEGMKTVFEE